MYLVFLLGTLMIVDSGYTQLIMNSQVNLVANC